MVIKNGTWMMKGLVLGSILALAGAGLLLVDSPKAPELDDLQEESGRLSGSYFHRGGFRGEAENMELEIDVDSGSVTVFAGFCTTEARRLTVGRRIHAWVEHYRSGLRVTARAWQIESEGRRVCPIDVSRSRASRAARNVLWLGIGLVATGMGLSLFAIKGGSKNGSGTKTA